MSSLEPSRIALLPATPASRGARDFRKTLSTHGFMETRFGPISYESSLEHDFVIMMAVDPQVTSIEHQPLQINFRTQRSNRLRKYTPDYLVGRDCSKPWVWGFPTGGLTESELIEIKPKARHNLSDRAALERYHAANTWGVERNVRFRVVSENFVSKTSVSNASGILAARNLSIPSWLKGRPVLKEPLALGHIVAACVENGETRYAKTLMHIGMARGWLWFKLNQEVSLTTLGYPV